MLIEGRITQHLSGMNYAENRPTRRDPFFIYAMYGLATAVAVGWTFYKAGAWLIEAAPIAYVQKTPLNYGLAITFTFVVAAAFYYLRELSKLRFLYPPIEIGISAALAATAVAQQTNPLLSLVALLAAVRVAVDGIVRLVALRVPREKPQPSKWPT